MAVLRASCFLASFLLFQIELITAKKYLPLYGGGCFVWGACLVFFQATLLLGYAFVHRAVSSLGMRRYRIVHLGVLFLPLPLFLVPLRPMAASGPSFWPAGDVFWRLTCTIGPAFFALSTVSVALSAWLAHSRQKERSAPYGLYATSNAGSLAGLLSYPFWFETHWGLGRQEFFWRSGYVLLALFSIWIFSRLRLADSGKNSEVSEESAPTPIPERLLWVLLSAGAVLLFMSVTNILTYGIAPAPFLWIVPLALYLLTFVLSFKRRLFCPRWLFKIMPVLLVAGASRYFVFRSRTIRIEFEMLLFCAVVFLGCLYAHTLLSKRRPVSKEGITRFYLTISFGGFLGGAVSAWLAPLVSKSFIEYLWALAILSAAGLFSVLWRPLKETSKADRFLTTAACVAIAGFFVPAASGGASAGGEVLYKHRNYYGTYEVVQQGRMRILNHGLILHGAQLSEGPYRNAPTAYYSPTSPIGQLLLSDVFSFKKIASIGLGPGTLAAYTNSERNMDFYELDPDVHRIAERYFTYLSHAQGSLRFFYGDARRMLRRNADERYDLVIVDAFGGDSVPFHLLTPEALKEYFGRMNEGGLVLFHVSNRFFRLEPVIAASAAATDRFALRRVTDGKPFGIPSFWVAVGAADATEVKLLSKGWTPIRSAEITKGVRWTDESSSLLSVMDLTRMRAGIRDGVLSFLDSLKKVPLDWAKRLGVH